MKGRLYAAFMERRGRRVFQHENAYWYEVPGRMLMRIPYHEPAHLPVESVRELLRITKCVGARYLTAAGMGLDGGLYVRHKSEYDLGSLHKKARNRVRNAIELCTVRDVDRAELAEQGLQLNRDTMSRQGRYEPEFGDPAQWARLVESCYACEGVRVIGAFAESELAAYTIALQEDGWLHLLHQFSSTHSLDKVFPNDALTYQVTKCAMDNPAVASISYGVAGLVRGEGLHDYKERRGYSFVPYGYAFVLRPAVHFGLTNALTYRALHGLKRTFPRRQVFERTLSVVDGARLTRMPVQPLENGSLAGQVRNG